jgi:aminoglycoside phosphotransferase family enzyme/predicted kinase
MNISTDRIIEELSRPEAYPEPVDDVRIIQTHISVVFLAGQLVYKVKKPVDFGFLDFTTLEKRRHFCHEELRLNRRLSPGLYLDVIPIVERDGQLRFGGEGEPVEYSVLMRRLDENRFLSVLVDRGEATPRMAERIAVKIAEFHRSAETSEEITRIGGTEAVIFNTEEDFQQIEPYVGDTLSRETYDLIVDYTRTFLEVNRTVLRNREEEGWIRDGHGDLHTQHICMDDGIQIYDCIEFNERFRYADVLCDAAFLAMDLDRLGRPDLAKAFTNNYLNRVGQLGTEPLYNFYTCYRGVVRGKVEGFRSRDANVEAEESGRAADNAREFMLLARRYATALRPQTLFITCGLMGSGKSSLAAGLADRLDLEILSTDKLRKEIAGLSPTESRHVPYGDDIYSADFTLRTYGELFSRAEKHLRRGRSVFIDGSFIDPVRRREALDVGRRSGCRPILLYLQAGDQLLRNRLRDRQVTATVTDGREEILGDQISAFRPPDEVPLSAIQVIDAALPPQEAVRIAYRRALSIP